MNSGSAVSEKIRAFLLSSFPNDGRELLESTDLLNDWFVDSLGIIMTVVFIEKTFGLEINGVDVNDENFHSIATLTQFVAKKTGQH